MKTYKQTIDKPRIEIEHDPFATSPREDSNLGYFITCDNKHYSPDKHETLQAIIKSTGEIATSQAEHIELIKKEYTEEKILAIYPVTKYEHGGVSYSLGTVRGFDNSNNGFYIITDKTQKELGTEQKDFESVIKAELEIYNKYLNGEVYTIAIYDKDGEMQESCGGFYDIEDMRSGLPKDLQDEDLTQYIIN